MKQRSKQPEAKTKKIQVNLVALTRLEWSAVVEVPADFAGLALRQLVDDFYELIDGSDYRDYSDYWERGACYAHELLNPVSQQEPPAYRVQRSDAGFIITPTEKEST